MKLGLNLRELLGVGSGAHATQFALRLLWHGVTPIIQDSGYRRALRLGWKFANAFSVLGPIWYLMGTCTSIAYRVSA